ncbi:type II toxin-antitoxin system PemK/MazF family toxin [Chryseobacterium rhizoplanae]|uniref:type II toxin-antitoxin system PemK/MazF family toxin n=1 Tax=Chryseobacterium rhizoplanae TaxID=1609531 RepID=UPI001CE24373|nr:type II toxin-antitoxin system PemK/MazF family toxin [Chryseobacterium rhizoplanae]UCA58603.1 type II toxin-antitoxin system PemK/MazF family toxin [Chryseobacterium rhizoplanae]
MSVKRGQIIYHNFSLPNLSQSELHPVLILSNEIVSTESEMYVGLMITSSDNYENDYFTFKLKDEMFIQNKLFKDNRYIRLHLISYFHCSSVSNPKILGEVKEKAITRILDEQRIKVFENE